MKLHRTLAVYEEVWLCRPAERLFLDFNRDDYKSAYKMNKLLGFNKLARAENVVGSDSQDYTDNNFIDILIRWNYLKRIQKE